MRANEERGKRAPERQTISGVLSRLAADS